MTVGGSRDRPDLTRGTRARRDLEDVLRRALHAAVDSIEPAEDGLARIMSRLTAASAARRAALRGSRQPTWLRWRPAGPWLRPALAVVGAVMIVVLGTIVLGQVREIVTKISLNTGPGASAPAHAGTRSAASSAVTPAQTGPGGPGTTPGQVGPTTHRRPCVLTSCPPSGSATPLPSPEVTPSVSPTAVPSPAATPSKTNHGHHTPHPSPSPQGPKGQNGS